jgi:hypothetical protein
MEKDFYDFQFFIQPSFNEENDTIDMVIAVHHIETDINTNAVMDQEKLRLYGTGYIFGLMQELAMILKKKLGYTSHLE